MTADTKTQIKFTFSGHESFQCRQLWLKKGYDFVNKKKSFNNDDAVVELGVGKNMVSSIRFWMKAFNLLTTTDELTDFAHKLLADDGYDPYMEDEGTLWLFGHSPASATHKPNTQARSGYPLQSFFTTHNADAKKGFLLLSLMQKN